ncbi:MAG: outer membrane lipoprotein carrier protein LolA [Proteobacteria bacterium]|nr:outer membrane lipoprotein carrier protein LolA [Pseudomonadota bacterium]
MKAAIALAILVLAPMGGTSQGYAAETPGAAAPAYAEVMALFAARTRGHVAFTETHELALLKTPVRSSGELVYVAPDRLEKHTLEPKPETLILDHGVLQAERGHHRYTIALADAPQVLPFIESVRATLAGDAAALERYFAVRFEGDAAHWRMLLTPRQAALAGSVSEIRMEGERAAISSVEIRERDGDRSLLSIGPELPP